jgi:RimJ/RimL family protein N-acetyltransferase
VTLEPLGHDHLDALGAAAADPRIWRYLSTDLRDGACRNAWLAAALTGQAAGSALPFAIRDARGTVVGSTRYLNIAPEHRRLEIGWTWLASSHWGGPTNLAMKLLMLKHAFEALGAIRVELRTDVLNQASRAAIARLGANEEGVLRRHMIVAEGRVRDTVQFAILDEQWPEIKPRLEGLILDRQAKTAD